MYTNECLYKDVYTIIEMMDNEMRSKINKRFINFLLENQDLNFKGTINNKIPLKEQNLRKEIKLMLSQIYIDYFCEEEKRKKILNIEKKNIENFYSRNIFEKPYAKKVNRETSMKEINNNLNIVKYKENIFTKIINRIRKFFIKKS